MMFFAAAFAVASVLALGVQAQTTNQQTATGQTGVTYSGVSGDQNNGAQTFGSGGSSFQASDPSLASGFSATSGTGTGHQTVGTTSSSSGAKSVLGTETSATGKKTELHLGGEAGQGNWVNTGDGGFNFANAGDLTSGQFKGVVMGNNGNPKATGVVVANGNSNSSTTGAGTNDVTSKGNTSGSSVATVTPVINGPQSECQKPIDNNKLSTSVSGAGSANMQAIAGNPNGNTYAGGYASGGATYNASSPTGAASGSLGIAGTTNGKILQTQNSTTVSGSSVMQSVAQAGAGAGH
jgi:hypothetical protein